MAGKGVQKRRNAAQRTDDDAKEGSAESLGASGAGGGGKKGVTPARPTSSGGLSRFEAKLLWRPLQFCVLAGFLAAGSFLYMNQKSG